MAKEKKEQKEVTIDAGEAVLDMDEINAVERIPVEIHREETPETFEKTKTEVKQADEDLVNCLKNETVIVRFIMKPRGMVSDPKHVLFGGMANGAKVQFTTPLLRTGGYADVLTKAEKKFLEYQLGLEHNALSVHNKHNNFWDDSNDDGIGRVELIKGDNPLDLSNPIDYIKYKILLANKEQIAPSMQALMDSPKATYRYVMIHENDTSDEAANKTTLKAQAYNEFNKMKNDLYKMRVVIEAIDGRPTAHNVKIEYLQGKIGDLIDANTKMFLQIAKDPLLDNKILIRKAIEAGIIANRGNFMYLKEGNIPLCESGQEPTMSVAAKFLSLPKNQEMKFSIEAKVK